MKKHFSIIMIALALLMAVSAAQASRYPGGEFRAFWVDTWHTGICHPGDTTTTVNYVKSCNCNVILAEVSKVADSYYLINGSESAYFPRATNVEAGYDALTDLCTKAHAQSIEVHAWVETYRCWTQTNPSPWPNHVYNLHPEWLSKSSTGAMFAGTESYLDPGNPAAENWLVDAYMEIVNNFDIDGLHWDHIRFPGTDWGYNTTAVNRFNKEFGQTGSPNPGNPDWTAWRKAQINAFVRKIYCKALAVKPNLKIGASVWKTALTGSRDYLQDWDAWMAGHYIDYVCPMNYTTANGTWTSINNTNLGNAHGRHVCAGQDANGNTAANTAWQVGDYLNSAGPGVAMFSYAGSASSALRDALVAGPLSTWVSPAPMSWKSSPTTGILMGTIRNPSLAYIYGAQVSINGTGLSGTTDGTGFYGITDVPAGTYSITISKCGHITQVINGVVVTNGAVTNQDVTLVPDDVPPVISNVHATSIQATNAYIAWNTDEVSTSQVEYGLDTSYGHLTTENTLVVTSHSVQLLSLIANTTYHYRVISKDCANASATSGDFTFTTAGWDTPVPIIKDNSDATGVSFSGSWITSSSGTDRYEADYRYCSGNTQGKTCTWTPTVITPGGYDVKAWWSQGVNRATNSPYFIQWNNGSQTVYVDQTTNGGGFRLLVANKPFLAGSSGFVRLSNNGVGSTVNVIADAIQLVSTGDFEPPSVPTNLHTTSVTTNRVDMAWNASTDNVAVAGYKVYRGAVMFTTVTTTSAYNSGLLANVQYPFSVAAYDTSNNTSAQCDPINTYTLSLPPTPGNITCDRSTNTWYNTSLFTFTSTEGWGVGVREYFRVIWDNNPTYTFTGGEEHWGADTHGASCEDPGTYYLHLQSCNGDGVGNGTYDWGPFKYDNTPPEVTVTDDGMYTDAAGQLHASWTGSTILTSGVDQYQYTIGTTSGGVDVRGWTGVGTDTSVTTTGLTLSAGTTYYFSVKAHNGAGLWSDPEASDGIKAATVVATISDAKALPNGTPVILDDKQMSAGFGTFCYLTETDRSSGIRANLTWPAVPAEVEMAGVLGTVNGERVLDNAEVKGDYSGDWPDPIFMINREIGGGDLNAYTPGITGAVGVNNIGLLIQTTGRVTHAETGFCYIDDGSALSDGSGYLGVKVDTTKFTTPPAFDTYVKVTGISGVELSGENSIRLIRPRGDGDKSP